MSVEIVREILGWSTLINAGILFWWLLAFVLVHDLLYRLTSRWFSLSIERFDAIQYAGMAIYKLSILMFNIVPYLALRIVD